MALIVVLFSVKVLQILTQETTPSPDLVATVKHLYETKLKVSFSIFKAPMVSASYISSYDYVSFLMNHYDCLLAGC